MPRTALAVVLYGRPGCTLCDEAAAMLGRISRQLPLEVTQLNIEDEDELLRRYVFEIPVIVVDGEEVGRAPISERRLADRLHEIARARR